jgi:hypothetical protein
LRHQGDSFTEFVAIAISFECLMRSVGFSPQNRGKSSWTTQDVRPEDVARRFGSETAPFPTDTV